MSSIAVQRVAIPHKENLCSKNSVLKSLMNETKSLDKFQNLGKINNSTSLKERENKDNKDNISTNKKFVAPIPPISKSTAYEKKYKSIMAQREAEYAKNLRSVKCNLQEKFRNGGSLASRENINLNRFNKFKFLNNLNNATYQQKEVNRKIAQLKERERSRSITARKESRVTNNLKTTPMEVEESFVSEKENAKEFSTEYTTNEETEKLHLNSQMSSQNSILPPLTEEISKIGKIEDNINNTAISLSKTDQSLEGNINLKINNSLDLILNEGDESLTEKDNDLLEIYMNDQLIFNQSEIPYSNLINSNRNISGNHVQIQKNYEYSIPVRLDAENSLCVTNAGTPGRVIQKKIQILPPPTLNFIQDNINKINLGIFTANYENLKTNKESHPRFTTEEYRRVLSTFLKFEYGKEIFEELFSTEEVNSNFLDRHEITERMRTRMIDWMIEVLSNYKCEENVFFLSVNIMDRYFKSVEVPLKPDHLHIVGICSMFLASKFYDIYPMKLKLIVEKVGHNKFSPEEIKQTEENIIKSLNYEMLSPTSFDFMNAYFEEIFFFIENNFAVNDETLSEYFKRLFSSCGVEIKLDYLYYEKYKNTKKFTTNMLNLLKQVVLYLTKMNCHDYSLISIKPSLLAASSIFVGMKICEQINNEEYINDFFLSKLIEISRNNEYSILFYAQKILHNAQNFDSLFNGLENLKKVHFNYILELKETK